MHGGKTRREWDDEQLEDDRRLRRLTARPHRAVGACRLALTSGDLPRPLRHRRPRHRLARPEARPRRRGAAELGAVVEEVTTDWCGEIVAVDRDLHTLTLEDRRGKRRTFPLGPGFLLEGRPVILAAPVRGGGPGEADAYGVRLGRRPRRQGPGRPGQPDLRRGPARRRAGREGLGRRPADRGRGRGVPRRRRRPRPTTCATSGPAPSAGSACSSTTWCAGSKESRIAQRIAKSPVGKHVLIVGHPFIDIWAAVKPERLGLQRWPDVPAQHRVEEGRLPAARLAAPRPGRHRPRLEAHPRQGLVVQRPRPGPARAGSRS